MIARSEFGERMLNGSKQFPNPMSVIVIIRIIVPHAVNAGNRFWQTSDAWFTSIRLFFAFAVLSNPKALKV
jgi:hypothetical protein